jgi:glycogen debranching enzyme
MSSLLQANVDAVNLWSEYDVEARTSLTDRALRNLKFGDAFAVLDSHGDIGTVEDTAEGLFFKDTRFLSHFELRLQGKRPLLLNSRIHDDKAVLAVDLTNPDLKPTGNYLRRDSIYLQRRKFLLHQICYERISIKNFAPHRHRIRLEFVFSADFLDMFEIRGTHRARHGVVQARVLRPEETEFSYLGLDGLERRTILGFRPTPVVLEQKRATIELELAPQEHKSVFVAVSCILQNAIIHRPKNYLSAYREVRRARRRATLGIATVTGSSDIFTEVVCRATSDTYTLITHTPSGPYPYAGIPWFNTVFGRDGIITAMLLLWMDPNIAKGVLRMLARTQATEIDSSSDAQPGKILHERRYGEMATLGEVPFAKYYGSIDATPLFLILAGQYLERTGDLATIQEIWPNILAALQWIDAYGDVDNDGFVEYRRATPNGLVNQGWKDSYDAIFHADGSDAEGPIALCEVQGYVFEAFKSAATMAAKLGEPELMSDLLDKAERLRQRFEEMFWCEDIQTYALALDGQKRPCQVVASNAGHALFSGIAMQDRACKVSERLLANGSFSGWGIRTLATHEARYNPMSYHNGSVWPHDNALIALGMRRYGLKDAACQVFAAIAEAAMHHDLTRLPELFCGFVRRPGGTPTPYPVACAPQAWAAASVFGLLQASLGLELRHAVGEIFLRDPVLPRFLNELVIRNLKLGDGIVDLRLHRHGEDVTANVLKRQGAVRVSIIK